MAKSTPADCRCHPLEPTQYDPALVKATRKVLGMSQSLFARFIGKSVNAVQAWEQGVNTPDPMACRFMDEIRHDPKHWKSRFLEILETKEPA